MEERIEMCSDLVAEDEGQSLIPQTTMPQCFSKWICGEPET